MGPSTGPFITNSTELALIPAIHGQLGGSGKFEHPQAPAVLPHPFILHQDVIAALQNEVAELKMDREIQDARHNTLL